MIKKATGENGTVGMKQMVKLPPNNFPVYEQRFLPRWETQSKAYYSMGNKHGLTTETKDLSMGGMCLQVAPEVHASQNLRLKIYLSNDVNFEAEGTVVWKRTTLDHRCLAGIAFEHLSERSQQLILAHAFELGLRKSKDT